MKKLLQILLIILIVSVKGYSQQGRPMERIHAAKIAYITDRLHLTSRQSGEFIPLYNDYEKELRSTRQRFFGNTKGLDPENRSDAEAMRTIDDNLDYQQAILDLKRKYKEPFLKVISPQQLAELNQAEREFKQMLMQRLKDRRAAGGGGGWRR